MCHIMSQSGSNESSLSPFYSVMNPGPWDDAFTFQMDLPISVFLIQKVTNILRNLFDNDCKSMELTIKMTTTEPSLDTQQMETAHTLKETTLQSETGSLVCSGEQEVCEPVLGGEGEFLWRWLFSVRGANFLLLQHLFLNLFMTKFFVTRVFPGIALAQSCSCCNCSSRTEGQGEGTYVFKRRLGKEDFSEGIHLVGGENSQTNKCTGITFL